MSVASENKPSDQPGVQHEDIAAWPIIAFVIFLLFGIGILTFLASQWFNREADQVNLKHAAEASYPELEQLYVNGLQQLNRYEMLDDSTFRIPIEQAIMKVAEEFPDTVRISEEMQR